MSGKVRFCLYSAVDGGDACNHNHQHQHQHHPHILVKEATSIKSLREREREIEHLERQTFDMSDDEAAIIIASDWLD